MKTNRTVLTTKLLVAISLNVRSWYVQGFELSGMSNMSSFHSVGETTAADRALDCASLGMSTAIPMPSGKPEHVDLDEDRAVEASASERTQPSNDLSKESKDGSYQPGDSLAPSNETEEIVYDSTVSVEEATHKSEGTSKSDLHSGNEEATHKSEGTSKSNIQSANSSITTCHTKGQGKSAVVAYAVPDGYAGDQDPRAIDLKQALTSHSKSGVEKEDEHEQHDDTDVARSN